jgi:8-oxo-dGTP diphosphatase
VTEGRYLAADGVVRRGDGDVLLLRRDHPPHEGAWVLPGGYVEIDETARAACEREVEEETGLAVDATGFVGLYDAPDRDPRGTVSAAYRCVPRSAEATAVEPGDEARELRWWDPAEPPTLGFDHAAILADATDTAGREV